MFRPHLLYKVFVGTALCAIGISVKAQETRGVPSSFTPALEQALPLCLALPDGKEEILGALTKAGWSESTEVATEYNPVVMMMASTFFARQHSTDDPKTFSYSAMNALFMGASILGNSDLAGQSQPLLQFNGVRLSVVGLGLAEPGQPYCLFGGPVELKEAIIGQFDFVPTQFNVDGQPQFGDGHQFLAANIDGNSVALFSFDQRQTLEEIQTLGPIISDVAPADFDYSDLVARFFPVTLLINASPE